MPFVIIDDWHIIYHFHGTFDCWQRIAQSLHDIQFPMDKLQTIDYIGFGVDHRRPHHFDMEVRLLVCMPREDILTLKLESPVPINIERKPVGFMAKDPIVSLMQCRDIICNRVIDLHRIIASENTV